MQRPGFAASPLRLAISEVEIEWGLGPGGFDRLTPSQAAHCLGLRNHRVNEHNARIDEINKKRKAAELERKSRGR